MQNKVHLQELDVTRTFIQHIEMDTFMDFNRDNKTLRKIDLR